MTKTQQALLNEIAERGCAVVTKSLRAGSRAFDAAIALRDQGAVKLDRIREVESRRGKTEVYTTLILRSA